MYKVIGIEMIDYVNKSNKRVTGMRLHCCFEKDNCNGVCVDSFYINNDKINFIVELGDFVEPLYNKYGNVQSIQVLGKE